MFENGATKKRPKYSLEIVERAVRMVSEAGAVRVAVGGDHVDGGQHRLNRQTPELLALGTVITELLLSKNILQESFALPAEVDRSYLGRIERGNNNAAVLTLYRIARGSGAR